MCRIFFALFLLVMISSSCAPLKDPVVIKHSDIKNFSHFYIEPSREISSISGSTFNDQYYTRTTTVNPSELITGILIKKGFIKLPNIQEDLANQTVIVNYGETGMRAVGMWYAQEVIIQFISAKTLLPVCSCTAEGNGSTEADDIRQAITRCLESLFKN